MAKIMGIPKIKLEKIKNKAIKGIFNNRIFLLFLFCCSLLFYQLLDFQSLKEKSDGYYVGGANFGDLPMHLAYITNFSYGKNFPPSNPFFANTPLRYPFLPDLLTSYLVSFNFPLRSALIFSSLLFFTVFLSINYFLIKKLFDKKIALFANLIFLFGTNLGGYYFLREVFKSKGSFFSAFGLISRHYTFDFNIRFYNLFANLFVPERCLLPGLIFFICAIYFLFLGIKERKGKNFLYAAIFTGFLPFIHIHCFLSLLIISFIWFFFLFSKSLLKSWFLFFSITLMIALPQLIWLFPVITKTHFLYFQFGWVKNQENFFLFWFKNLGFLLFLVPFGFLKLKKSKKVFLLPAIVLFFLANLVIFQPWDWDNIKIFIICFWFFSIAGAVALKQLLNHGLIGKFLVFSLTIGIASYFPLAYRFETRNSYRLYSREDIKLAEWIRKNTPHEAVFLTDTNHNQLISTLAGRQTFLGYPGYLWVHGIDYKEREKLSDIIFKGEGDLNQQFLRYNLSYLVFDNLNKNQHREGLKLYQKNFPKIYEDRNFIIFTLK